MDFLGALGQENVLSAVFAPLTDPFFDLITDARIKSARNESLATSVAAIERNPELSDSEKAAAVQAETAKLDADLASLRATQLAERDSERKRVLHDALGVSFKVVQGVIVAVAVVAVAYFGFQFYKASRGK